MDARERARPACGYRSRERGRGGCIAWLAEVASGAAERGEGLSCGERPRSSRSLMASAKPRYAIGADSDALIAGIRTPRHRANRFAGGLGDGRHVGREVALHGGNGRPKAEIALARHGRWPR